MTARGPGGKRGGAAESYIKLVGSVLPVSSAVKVSQVESIDNLIAAEVDFNHRVVSSLSSSRNPSIVVISFHILVVLLQNAVHVVSGPKGDRGVGATRFR